MHCPKCGDRIFKIYDEGNKKVVRCRQKHKLGLFTLEVS